VQLSYQAPFYSLTILKWAGYDSDADRCVHAVILYLTYVTLSNSWEPENNVKECQRLLKSFWTHIGIDEEDYPPGYSIEASPEWISMSAVICYYLRGSLQRLVVAERRYFAEECKQQQREAKQQRELEERKEKELLEKKLSVSFLQGRYDKFAIDAGHSHRKKVNRLSIGASRRRVLRASLTEKGRINSLS
jgi:hypothetical protein